MAKRDNSNDDHKAIPTSRVGRFARVARMAGGVAGGMLAEGTRQLRAGKRPKARDMLLTPGQCPSGGRSAGDHARGGDESRANPVHGYRRFFAP